ncbi:hypothetical protein [Celerinatantimonas sp. YJH-8]|uniref:hypothetical protein n=1 Tax=Celerinatantimonas sp. YJH-8 TaxID=3228714 RepID=UPI0038C56738
MDVIRMSPVSTTLLPGYGVNIIGGCHPDAPGIRYAVAGLRGKFYRRMSSECPRHPLRCCRATG